MHRLVYSLFAAAGLMAMFLSGCGGNYPSLETVKRVDIARYTGKWYEIARLPNSFQKECDCSTAEYTILDASTIAVYNRCTNRKDGSTDGVNGKAFIVPNSNNAKLKVQFFWPFKGDYWVIALDEANYHFAMVGEPSRKYLWILARTPQLDRSELSRLLDIAAMKGFNTNEIIYSKQNCP